MNKSRIAFEKINTLIKGLESLQPMSSDSQRKLEKKFRLEFNYNSNHIEGNTLTYGETELLLIFDDTKGNHTLREYEEMKAHDVAYQLIRDWAKSSEQPLNERDIKELNKILLVRPFWKDAITSEGQPTRREIKVGEYKTQPNSVRLQNGEMFHYASPMETPILMGELISWFRAENETKELHPVALAALLHYKFVCIHPFDDGNGRVSRLLMNYVLFNHNLPPVIIKSANKRAYLSALNSADTGDIDSFIEYIAQQVQWSLEVSIKAAKGESIEEADDLDKEIAVLKKELSNNNVLEQAATADNVAQVIENNIIPLFVLIEDKCGELKDFFFDFDKNVKFRLGEPSEFGLGGKESVWSILIENWLNNNIRRNQKKVSFMSYDYTLKGFKNNLNAPNFTVSFIIFLNDYNYTIKKISGTNKSVTMPYNKTLSKETLMEFVTPAIKDLIESIKRVNSET